MAIFVTNILIMKSLTKLLWVLFLMAHVQVFGQDCKVIGRVVSSDNQQGLAFVNVSLNNTYGTFTDENGNYSVEQLPAGTYTLQISCIGFEDYSGEPFELSAGDVYVVKQVQLQAKSIQIAEVTITEQQKVWDSRYTGSNNVISAKKLERIQPIGSEEMLRTVPGVNIAGDMGISNRPNISIRGSDPRRSNKILLLEDGSPISPAPYLAPGAYYNVPADRLDGIQVIKGPDVLAYGSNTIFGVVNYITRRPMGDPSLKLRVSGGQRGFFDMSGSYGGTWGKSGAELMALYKRFDGYTDNADLELLNLSGKWFSELSDRQSLYTKIVIQKEYVNNSLSGITPFTFEQNPEANPFDADEFTSHRYGLDVVHSFRINDQLTLQTKVYGSDFYRDWWKQNSTVIHAGDVQTYVGDSIYEMYYSYLDGQEFGEDDYVRVGKVVNGIESNSDSRWQYLVYGAHEKATWKWAGKHQLEAMLKVHGETYRDIVIEGDSSKWARSGRTTVDAFYTVLAGSSYIRNDFRLGNFSIIPIMRYEQIALTKSDLLLQASNPANTGGDFGVVKNNFGEFTPGLSLVWRELHTLRTNWELFSGLYQAFSSPTTAISFNEVLGGEVIPATDIATLEPEKSFNQELGARWVGDDQKMNGQVALFNMFIDNFYSPARSQAFETLGSVRISGAELATSLDISKCLGIQKMNLLLGGSFTMMQSAITSGKLRDADLFTKVMHTDATSQELIDKINEDRNAYEVYFGETLYEGASLAYDQFDDITAVNITYGEGFADDYTVPYVPAIMYNLSLSMEYDRWIVGGVLNHVGEQYAEFFNFETESADGSIGKLPAYYTLDANISYEIEEHKGLDDLRFFISGKNLTNDIYRSSRLNRATGGIFPGGFIQINAGISIKL
jgi:Fe(3+) dicitrate transport protein